MSRTVVVVFVVLAMMLSSVPRAALGMEIVGPPTYTDEFAAERTFLEGTSGTDYGNNVDASSEDGEPEPPDDRRLPFALAVGSLAATSQLRLCDRRRGVLRSGMVHLAP